MKTKTNLKRREVRMPEPEDGYLYRMLVDDGSVYECGDLALLLRRLAETINEDGRTFCITREAWT